MKTKIKTLVCLCLIHTLIVTGCAHKNAKEGNPGTLSGTVTVSGAWALYPLMVRWGEEFQKLYPDVQFDISAGGAGKGMADALAGAVEIGMVSREIYPEEIERGAFWISVTKDAVFPTINEANPIWNDLSKKGISRDMLIGIFITGEITTWGELVGKTELTDPIYVFTRSDACGAASTWAQYLDAMQEDLLGVAVYGDPGLLDAVIKNPLGIGFNNLNYAYDMETGQLITGARVLPIDLNNNGKVDPEEIYNTKDQALEAVATGRYPSPPGRDLNLVTFGQPSGLVKTFLVWVLTDGQQYVEEAGYITLPGDKLETELEKLD
jgi:phosphate transport system substrate-binding protein